MGRGSSTRAVDRCGPGAGRQPLSGDGQARQTPPAGAGLMQPAPRLWRCLVQEWVPLPPNLGHAWWYALARSRWSLACEWRETFLAFHRRPERTSGEDVEDFFAAVATPAMLFGLLQALLQEQVLIPREKR